MDIAQILTQRARDKHKGVFMKQAKHGSISALVLLALMTTFAAGCYYDRDDRWGYHRYPERRYSYDRDRDWRRDWRYDRDDDRRYSRSNPFRDHYND